MDAKLLRKLLHNAFGQFCAACGEKTIHRSQHVISDELAATWELDWKWRHFYAQREGTTCRKCSTNLRSQQMAAVIADELNRRFGTSFSFLKEAAASKEFRSLRVAEINSCGNLHHFWKDHPALAYSEYRSQKPGVRHEDLLRLSYADNAFDLVLTSETLEHVPDLEKACAEIRRVLAPDGLHIFTVPVVTNRITRKRADVLNGKLIHRLAPSYHGSLGSTSTDLLVFYEFGDDIRTMLEACGFAVRHYRNPTNPALNTFVIATISH